MRPPYALVRLWPAAAAAMSAAMLATAHVFESLGYAPCNLCYRQREVYWGALAVALVGIALAALKRLPIRLVSLLLGAVFAAGVIVAAFHAGVEWKWWPGPASCTAQAGLGDISTADLTGILEGAKFKPPACDEAAWRLLGLSMAGWNTLVSLALTAVSLVVAVRGEDRA